MERRAFLAGGLAALGGCGVLGRSWTFRYRLDVYMRAPELHASTVIETKYSGPTQSLGFPTSFLYRTRAWGDAPSFETRGGGRLFATFTGGSGDLARAGAHFFAPTNERTLVSVLANSADMEAFREGRLYDELEAMTGVRDLAPEQWPRFIWLADETDLSTAHFAPRPGIDYGPMGGSDTPRRALATILGSGADIARVTIEQTDADIVQDLHQRLPWLTGMNGDDGKLVWESARPFWQNLIRPQFALRGENNDMTR